jgi:YjeF-related protein N-terminus
VTREDDAFTSVPAHQLDIQRRMQVPIALAAAVTQAGSAQLIVDGIIGYSLSGAPRSAAAELIRWANAHGAPILVLDTPSGIDTTTGAIFDPAIRATATMTLALPKAGLRAPGVEPQVGELYLADISVPPELYASPALGLHVEPLFARDEILRLGWCQRSWSFVAAVRASTLCWSGRRRVRLRALGRPAPSRPPAPESSRRRSLAPWKCRRRTARTRNHPSCPTG